MHIPPLLPLRVNRADNHNPKFKLVEAHSQEYHPSPFSMTDLLGLTTR